MVTRSFFVALVFGLIVLPAQAQWVDDGTQLHTDDYIGIGTSSPRSFLDVNGSIYTTGSLFVEDENSPSNLWFSQDNGKTKFGEVNDDIVYQKVIMTLDLASGEVGVGTGDPTSTLDVHGDVRLNDDALWLRPNNDQNHGLYLSRTGSVQGTFAGDETDGPALFGYKGGLLGTTGGGHGDRIVLKWTDEGNVGIGTTSPGEKLSVNGKIRSKEVIVENTNWPDFVFESDYDLRTLDAVDAFIDANGHLPDVPSADVVERGGQRVGATQATLLQKIEELTLYTLQQKEQIDAQRETIETLRESHTQQIESLRQQLEALQKRVESKE